MKLTQLTLLSFGLLCGQDLMAQGKNELLDTWTKRVSRIVVWGDSVIPFRTKLKNAAEELNLVQLIFNAATSGKITAYGIPDTKFSYPPLSRKAIRDIIDILPADTIEMQDADGNMTTKVVKKDIPYDQVRKFKVLEEWTYDVKKARTTIQIVGIAPFTPPGVGFKGGAIIGDYPLFWVRYDDIRNLLLEYQQGHPNSNIPLSVWNSYFTETE